MLCIIIIKIPIRAGVGHENLHAVHDQPGPLHQEAYQGRGKHINVIFIFYKLQARLGKGVR